MTATRVPTRLARERAHELDPCVGRPRPGPLGSLLGRVTAVDQVGVEERVDCAQEALDQEGRRSCGRSTSRSG